VRTLVPKFAGAALAALLKPFGFVDYKKRRTKSRPLFLRSSTDSPQKKKMLSLASNWSGGRFFSCKAPT
jgi:hypothetical protein